MNHKHIDTTDELEQQGGGEYTVKRSYHSTIIAAAICLLLALLVWIVVMSRPDSDYLSVCVVDPQAGYTYEVSADMIKVEGKVSDLRHAEVVGVRLPEHAGSGEYKLSEGQLELELPDGVQLSVDIDLTVTVRAK
jgi:hypothetical protein